MYTILPFLSFHAILLIPAILALTTTIDLGYTVQQGTSEIGSTDFRYFNFTNVRYAASPTGSDRFRPARDPTPNRIIQTAGKYGIACIQAQAGWIDYVGANVGNQTWMPPVTTDDISPQAYGASEDCLFLDIFVPYHLIRSNTKPLAPVLLFIHGGGFAEGSKTAYGQGQNTGIGLVEAAAAKDQDIIFVAINYRLGLYGFLAGTNLTEVPSNLGLLDQRFAMQWVDKYIHLFGGDRKQITILGQSAGAGSIMHHLASTEQRMFRRVILQSPWKVDIPQSKQEETFANVLRLANVTTFSELKGLSTEKLQMCNSLVVGNSEPYGTFTFGPVVDVTGQNVAGQIREEGHEDRIPLMIGHNSAEGAIFTSPFVKTDLAFNAYLLSLFPNISQSALENIAGSLYPNDYSGDYGYTNLAGRLETLIADSMIVCNAYMLDKAVEPGHSYAYEFSIPPAWHSDDLPYTFWRRGKDQSAFNTTLAAFMQSYITNFVATGSPHPNRGENGLPAFDAGIVLNLNGTELGPKLKNRLETLRCEWWQKGLYH